MRRHLPGLNSGHDSVTSHLDGIFLVLVDKATYRWHVQKPSLALLFVIFEPATFEALCFSGRLYCTERALWKLTWFLKDFGYDTELLTRDQVDEKAIVNLRCPRSYRHCYLDGWREKDTRAAMIFGRCFEKALESYFCDGDCGVTLHQEWSTYRDTPFEYKRNETWDRLVHQGVQLLERFAQDDRVHIPEPQQNLQIKVVRELPYSNEFVGYIDAIGEIDGVRCLLDWKTTTNRYPEGPAGLLSLDPQLICYSWMTGISEVAMVVFVRKYRPELQYLLASISDEQRLEFGKLVGTTNGQIEAAQFPSHSGIRFPRNGCVSCSHLGLCLDDQKLIESNLILRPGATDLAWLDQLVY